MLNIAPRMIGMQDAHITGMTTYYKNNGGEIKSAGTMADFLGESFATPAAPQPTAAPEQVASQQPGIVPGEKVEPAPQPAAAEPPKTEPLITPLSQFAINPGGLEKTPVDMSMQASVLPNDGLNVAESQPAAPDVNAQVPGTQEVNMFEQPPASSANPEEGVTIKDALATTQGADENAAKQEVAPAPETAPAASSEQPAVTPVVNMFDTDSFASPQPATTEETVAQAPAMDNSLNIEASEPSVASNNTNDLNTAIAKLLRDIADNPTLLSDVADIVRNINSSKTITEENNLGTSSLEDEIGKTQSQQLFGDDGLIKMSEILESPGDVRKVA